MNAACAKYGRDITKEDIFFYVYGFLHHPKYRETFKDDLKKSLPKIPFVDKAEDFRAFSKAGRDLAQLHLNYENIKPPPDIEVMDKGGGYRVSKMQHPKKNQRDTIIYNSNVTISNIPAKAYDYVISGWSAIKWVMDSYQVEIDKRRGSMIVNDPNLYMEEIGDPKYILNLLLSVIGVSVRTVEIIEGLPESIE